MVSAIQAKLNNALSINVDSPVLFDTISYQEGFINYNSATGTFTFNEYSKYKIDWWIAVQSSSSSNGVVFAIETSQGDVIEGTSPIKTNEVYGTAIIDSGYSPTISLVNKSTNTVFLSQNLPLQGSITITQLYYEPPKPPEPSYSIIPYSDSYMYLFNSGADELFVSDNYYFVMPIYSNLERLYMSVKIRNYYIEPGAIGTIGYNVYKAPINSDAITIISSGFFSPNITTSTLNDSYATADIGIFQSVSPGERIAISLTYSTNDASLGNVNLEFFGGLSISIFV